MPVWEEPVAWPCPRCGGDGVTFDGKLYICNTCQWYKRWQDTVS